MKIPDALALPLVPRLAALLIRGVRATMRLRCSGREHLDAIRARGGSYIHAFWHGHLFLMPYAHDGERIAILISEHRDGEYIARTMARFGHESVRGSTTSGGAAVLRKAVRMAARGYDLGFTPDGPRGPRHVVQMGVIMAARLSGLPIVPVAFGASRAAALGSWDRFIVPRPFARGVFVYGPPRMVPAGAGPEEMERVRADLEGSMRACAGEAEALASDRVRFAALRPLPGRR